MPNQTNYRFIPIMTSLAGSCLTLENWQQSGVDAGVYYLDALLTKPGIEVLRSFGDLRHYTAWSGTIILNTCTLLPAKLGDYLIRSPYDGSKLNFSKKHLLSLINHLQPDYVIWPTETVDATTSESILSSIVLSPGENQSAVGSLNYWIDSLEISKKMSCDEHRSMSVWFESDRPAHDALQGKIYHAKGVFNLLDACHQEEFVPLDEHCSCMACDGGYTRAYFHHLLQQTPLLAQRFLILHNVYSCAKKIELLQEII